MLAERARSVALLACIAAAHSLLGADLGGGRLPRPLSARRRLLRLLPLRAAAAEDASRPASAAAAEDAAALAAPTGAASPADSHGNASVAELWCATDARGREWCAVGTNRSRAAEWLAHELGAPVELAGVAECAPLAARRTHRRLRRAWRGGRLLLCGSSLGELLEEGAGASPERSFRRSLGGLAVRARRMSPARHEAAALRGYLERHFLPSHPALSLSDLSPAAAAADPARSEEGIRAMLRWFKEAFPYERGTCASCGASAGYRGTVRASRRERGRLAARAELWRCGECSSWQRFARYNSVPQILRDRRGRCGEYTNAMLQLVLALGWRTALPLQAAAAPRLLTFSWLWR